MKEKGVTKIALILLVLVCVFAIVACSDNVNTDGDVCKHIYTEKAEATYLKSAATCTEKAVYYKSCSLCGEKDTATFEYGEALGHAYGDDDDGKCTVCGQQIVGTKGVVYVSYVTYAVVTGYIGTESDVKIAAFYKDLPVIRIENKAFYDCTSLTSVTIPDSVTSIGEWAFYNCASLTSVTIGNNVKSIGNYAFYNCRWLTSVAIPNSITSIGEYAFFHCTSLKRITIPDSVTSIGEWAFYNCTSLTSVTIPDSVTSIGGSAFFHCSSLTSVNITDIAAWCNISFGGYYANPLYYAENLYLNNNLVTALTIPDSITSIGERAFV